MQLGVVLSISSKQAIKHSHSLENFIRYKLFLTQKDRSMLLALSYH